MNPPLTDWPYRGVPIAWCSEETGLEAMSIPLLPSDRTLTLDQYLQRLGDRVQWLLNWAGDGDPKWAFQRIVERKAGDQFDLRGINPDRFASLGRQIVGAIEDLLRQYHGLNELKWSQSVSPREDAVLAIKETDLEGWLDSVLLPNCD